MADAMWPNPPPAKRSNFVPEKEKSITILFEFDGILVELSNVVKFLVKFWFRYVDRPLKIFPWASREILEAQASVKRDKLLNHLEFSFIAETKLPTRFGEFRFRAYRDLKTMKEPMVIISGDLNTAEAIPLRVHDQCFTSEVLGSLKCDCKEQLDFAMTYIRDNGPGIIIYLQQEGRGMGLGNKIKAYHLQEYGYDTVDANAILGFEEDTREYYAVPYILQDLGIKNVKLLTNNPRKVLLLNKYGIPISGRIPVIVNSQEFSANYLKSKATRMGHFI